MSGEVKSPGLLTHCWSYYWRCYLYLVNFVLTQQARFLNTYTQQVTMCKTVGFVFVFKSSIDVFWSGKAFAAFTVEEGEVILSAKKNGVSSDICTLFYPQRSLENLTNDRSLFLSFSLFEVFPFSLSIPPFVLVCVLWQKMNVWYPSICACVCVLWPKKKKKWEGGRG